MQPYRGLFVLDAAQGIAGPNCGMLLAALPGPGPMLNPAPGLGEHTAAVPAQSGVPA